MSLRRVFLPFNHVGCSSACAELLLIAVLIFALLLAASWRWPGGPWYAYDSKVVLKSFLLGIWYGMEVETNECIELLGRMPTYGTKCIGEAR